MDTTQPARETASPNRSALGYALIAVAPAYFTVMATRQIARRGLYYDEVLVVNPAIGGAVSKAHHWHSCHDARPDAGAALGGAGRQGSRCCRGT
jgi:hypothetical protein